MTLVMGTWKNAFGQSASSAFTVASPAADPAPPVPVVEYASLALPGDNFSQAIARLKAPSVVHVPAGTYEMVDFSQGVAAGPNGYGLYVPNCRGIIGDGIDKTIIRMRANSSKRAGDVPAQSAGGTNNLALMRIGIGTTAASTAYLRDFTLQGTPQGHLYNGLVRYHTTGSYSARIKLTGIPGNNSAPPGETFADEHQYSTNALDVDLEVDGRDATGAKVGSAGFGTNYSTGVKRVRCNSHHSGFGAGFTEFQCSALEYDSCISTDNAKIGFNFERASGTVILTSPTTLRNGVQYVMDSDIVSTNFSMSNPITDVPGTVNVRIDPTYGWPVSAQKPEQQLASAIIVTGAKLVVLT